MRNYTDKIIAIEKRVSSELGKFNAFALIERETINRWDILISLPNAQDIEQEVITKVHAEFFKELPKQDAITIARIVVLEPTSPFVKQLNEIAHVEHSKVELKDEVINNLRIKYAMVISSQA